MKRFPSICLVVLSLLLAVGCASSSQTRLTADDVLTDLRARGVTAEPGGPASRTFLSVPGRLYTVPQGTLELYTYRSSTSATLDAEQIDGQTVGRVEPPFFYHRDNIIAIYYGTNAQVRDILEDVIGSGVL